jgi:hypothetical protein
MSSDVAGGCQVRFEVAVGDFERFLLVGKGASAATQQCYVRHVQAMLAELCDATGTIDLGRVGHLGTFVCHEARWPVCVAVVEVDGDGCQIVPEVRVDVGVDGR